MGGASVGVCESVAVGQRRAHDSHRSRRNGRRILLGGRVAVVGHACRSHGGRGWRNDEGRGRHGSRRCAGRVSKAAKNDRFAVLVVLMLGDEWESLSVLVVRLTARWRSGHSYLLLSILYKT